MRTLLQINMFIAEQIATRGTAKVSAAELADMFAARPEEDLYDQDMHTGISQLCEHHKIVANEDFDTEIYTFRKA